MRNGSYAQLSPEAVAEKLPEARALLREAHIDTTSRMRLSDAALATGTNLDELLAVAEDRARRNARKAARRNAHARVEEVDEHEFMLV
jgi:hypothetical protein